MKDFEQFRDSLSNDVLKEIEEKAMVQANEMYEQKKDSFEKIMLPIMHERYYTAYFTIALLEKYHQWLAE